MVWDSKPFSLSLTAPFLIEGGVNQDALLLFGIFYKFRRLILLL